jgi:hypothetical protein
MGRRWFSLIPLSIITVMATTAIAGEFLTRTPLPDPLANRCGRHSGSREAKPSVGLIMGRDLLTHDYGARVSLLVAVLALLVGSGMENRSGTHCWLLWDNLDAW